MHPLTIFALGAVAGLVLKAPFKVVIKSAVRGALSLQQSLSGLAAELMEEIEDDVAAEEAKVTQNPRTRSSSAKSS